MASSRGIVHSDTAKKEPIITEFFTKALQIILESRLTYMSSRNYSGEQALSSPSPSPSSSSSSSSCFRPRDKWFNLRLRACPAALENIDFWRPSNLEPMVIDVILVQRSADWDPLNYSPQRDVQNSALKKEQVSNFMNLEPEEFRVDQRNKKVMERWVVQYEDRKSSDCVSGGETSSGNFHSLYKKAIVLLRSLYSTTRFLPAYKVYRELISSGQLCTYTLKHTVSTFSEPFTRREEADMQRFCFTPVDTACGKLSLSVSYRPIPCDVVSEPSTPVSPQLIQDYVGSLLTDPLKRFLSLPRSHGSPSCSPFSRRHSWSYENYRASPPLNAPSPSPTYSDSCASITNCRARPPPPQHFPKTVRATRKDAGFNEYWPSPLFSPSPSPPMYIANTDASKSLLWCESAPLNIPVSKAFSKQTLPPSPSPMLTRAATLKSYRSTRPSGSFAEKFPLGRDESGRCSGVRILANSSLGISFSRSSSRLSIPNDFDDTEFACPFDVDDDEMIGSRPESFDSSELGGSTPFRKSQDVAVGALVSLLKKAPPLRQDSVIDSKSVNCHSNKEPVSKPDEQRSESGPSTSILSSSLTTSRTTADALEELRSYKELKALLLSQGKSSHRFCDNTAEEASSGKSL